jgi:hypothetical protein
LPEIFEAPRILGSLAEDKGVKSPMSSQLNLNDISLDDFHSLKHQNQSTKIVSEFFSEFYQRRQLEKSPLSIAGQSRNLSVHTSSNQG